MEPLALVVFIVVVALVFDFINGFHDAANSIATVVSTRVLSPTQAVVWAAFLNFVAAFGFGVSVARTIGKGIVRPESVDALVFLAALIGAITWNLITWYGRDPVQLLPCAHRWAGRRGGRPGPAWAASSRPAWPRWPSSSSSRRSSVSRSHSG